MKPEDTAMEQAIWDKRPDESARQYSYARTYFSLGPRRSIKEVSQIVERSSGHLKRLSAPFGWRRRAQAYDLYRAKVEADAEDRLHCQEAEKWAKLESEQNERMYQTSEKLLDQVNKMLAFPLVEVTAGDTSGVQIVKPVKWQRIDILKFMLFADQLSDESIKKTLCVNSRSLAR